MWEFFVILCIASFMTLLTYIYPYKPTIIKEHEKRLSISSFIFLYFIRFFHYCTFTFSIIYIFLFGMEYDIYYFCCSALLWFHWQLFNNECVLTLIEKQILDPNYRMGDKPKYHPFIDIISHDLNRLLVFLMFCSIYIVFFRNILKICITYLR